MFGIKKEENKPNNTYLYRDGIFDNLVPLAEAKLFARVVSLVNVLRDLSSEVLEMEYVDYKTVNVKTSLGLRTVVTDRQTMNNLYSISYGKDEEIYFTIQAVAKINTNKDNEKIITRIYIDVTPKFGRGQTFSEEEIYLAIKELEDIISKYDNPRASKIHEKKLNNLIQKFE